MAIVADKYDLYGEEVEILIQVDSNGNQSSSPYGNMREGTKVHSSTDQPEDIFNRGLALARSCAAITVINIQKLSKDICPDEFELQLAIKLDGELGAYLVKLGGEAQMQVSMKWVRKK